MMMNDKATSIMRRAAKKIAPSLIKLNITPNEVTLGYFLLLMPVTVYLLSLGNYFCNLLAIFLLWVTRFMDHLDGELARARSMTSKLGAKLDYIVGYLSSVFVFVGIGLSLRDIYPLWFLFLSCLIISTFFFKVQTSKLNFFLRSHLFWMTVCVPFNVLVISFFLFVGVGCLSLMKLTVDGLWRVKA